MPTPCFQLLPYLQGEFFWLFESITTLIQHTEHRVHQSKLASDPRKKLIDNLIDSFHKTEQKKQTRMRKVSTETTAPAPCKLRL